MLEIAAKTLLAISNQLVFNVISGWQRFLQLQGMISIHKGWMLQAHLPKYHQGIYFPLNTPVYSLPIALVNLTFQSKLGRHIKVTLLEGSPCRIDYMGASMYGFMEILGVTLGTTGSIIHLVDLFTTQNSPKSVEHDFQIGDLNTGGCLRGIFLVCHHVSEDLHKKIESTSTLYNCVE